MGFIIEEEKPQPAPILAPGPQVQKAPSQFMIEDPAPPQADPGGYTLGGFGKAAVSGLGQGVAGIVGAQRGVNDLVKAGMAGASDLVGAPEFADRIREAQGPYGYMPSYTDVVEGTKDVTGIGEGASEGKFYDPKNLAERLTQNVGEMLPTAPAMGGIGGAAKTGLYMTAGGELANAFGGEDQRQTGELLGGLLSGRKIASKRPTASPVTSAELKKTAGNIYDDFERTAVNTGTRGSLQNSSRTIKKGMRYDPVRHKELNVFFDKMDEYRPQRVQGNRMHAMTGKGTPHTTYKLKDMDMRDLEDLRQDLDAAKKAGGRTAEIAYELENQMDDVVANMRGGKKFGEARNLWFRAKKNQFLENLQKDLEADEGAFRTTSRETAIRNKFKNLDKQMRRDTPAGRRLAGTFDAKETRMIHMLANPGKYSVQNVSRYVAAAMNNPQTRGLGMVGSLAAASQGNIKPLLVYSASMLGGQMAARKANKIANKNYNKFVQKASGAPKMSRAPNVAQLGIRPMSVWLNQE